ncbi:MAG: zinc-ribbon domain-containing protein [Caldicoprobacterales bacterium]|jgi:hypothetical protein
MARKKNNKIPLPILILIYACLLFAIYNSLITIALGLWGNTVMGTVDSYNSRLDDPSAGENRSRTISKGYYFMVNGKEYRGYVMYQSDESWPRLKDGETRSERISYFSFFPYINKPSVLTDFSQMGEMAILYHIFSPIACAFLLFLVTGTLKRNKKRKKAAKKDVAPQNLDKRSDINMFCRNCGDKLKEGAAFCSKCGTKAISFAPQENVDMQSMDLIGFSDRYKSPEILGAAEKNRKSSIGCIWILVLVPLIGFPIAGLLMDDFPFGESVVIGIGIALIMLIFNLFALRRTKQPMWEGTIVNKYSKERNEHRGGEDDNYRTYTEYTTVVNTDAGKKKTIVEKDSQRHMYDYLAVGDRVRYHPKFGTYEKYDKSKDRIIYCNVCSIIEPQE